MTLKLKNHAMSVMKHSNYECSPILMQIEVRLNSDYNQTDIR